MNTTRTLVAFVAAFALAVACGGGAKPAPTTPSTQPSGGDLYGSGAEGGVVGGVMGGSGYGGAVAQPAGIFDCTSGIAECDEAFKRTVTCLRTATGMDDYTRNTTIDTMQQTCVQVRDAAVNSPDVKTAVADGCKQGLADMQKSAAQLGCTF